MDERLAVTATLVLAASVVAGCATSAPPQRVSAILPKDTAIYGESPDVCGKADALVVAQCRKIEEYSSTVQGNWVQHWYLTEWRVIRVERGEWPAETVSFVFRESSVSPQSSIVLRRPTPVYYKGAVLGFCIDTSKSKPVIVAQQARSRLPSYGSLRRPHYDAGDPNSVQVIQHVTEAARQFLQAPFGGVSLAVTEEYDAFFVVEVRTAEDSVALIVRKGNYRVGRIPNAYDEADRPDAGV